MDNNWYTESVVQVRKGAAKRGTQVRKKVALHSREVRDMIKLVEETEPDIAAIMAIARLYMLRVPSEGLPLQWHGAHSKIEVQANSARITLAKRKNHRAPIDLVRECCCSTSGRALCAVHWLQQLRERDVGATGLFDVPLHRFRAKIKELAQQVGVTDWAHVGTHSFRRGMAQDIVDTGSPLSVLLRAGGWSSSAYLEYLREGQCSEAAAGQAVIWMSDSDADC